MWKALSGRIAFNASAPLPHGAISVLPLYKQVWGVEPQGFQAAQNPMMPSTAQGNKEGMSTVCALLPNRLEFSLSPFGKNEPESEPSLNLIEDSATLYRELFRFVTQFGKGTIDVPKQFDRASIVAQFASIEPTVKDANRALTQTIPKEYRPNLTDEEAFILQINRPREISRNGGKRVNFLTKWSVEQFQVFSFAVSHAGAFPAGMLQQKIGIYIGACITFDCSVLATPGATLVSRADQMLSLSEGLKLICRAQSEFGLKMEGFSDVQSTH